MSGTYFDRVIVAYLSEPVFEDLRWEIHDGCCVGLAGANGGGWGTLLTLRAGVMTPDSGSLVLARGKIVGYLPRDPAFPDGRTSGEEVLTASTRLAELERKLLAADARLSDPGRSPGEF